VLKVFRQGNRHSIKELEVQVMLQGNFETSFTKGDNRLVVATDSMKNIVNVLACEKLGPENEPFGLLLAEHFLRTYRQVKRVEVTLSERIWERICPGRKPHPHSFVGGVAGRNIVRIVASSGKNDIESGFADLLILKTTDSGFENFVRDRYTTLAETNDRVLATKLKASWVYARRPKSFSKTNRSIIDSLLAAFANHRSPSVQSTLFEMGQAALRTASEISRIHLAMPNQHCLAVNLLPFGVENKNELFVPTDEPHGQIEGTVSRH
jgi:urate oxidase